MLHTEKVFDTEPAEGLKIRGVQISRRGLSMEQIVLLIRTKSVGRGVITKHRSPIPTTYYTEPGESLKI